MNMEKTIEEKKAAVLAECELRFEDTVPGQSVEIMPSVTIQNGYITDLFGDDDMEYECIYLNMRGRVVAELWSKSNGWEIDLFYKLLGLEARELREELQAEKAASAKLVEALEASKRYCEYGNGVGGATLLQSGKYFDEGDGTLYHTVLTALEAHKKGASPNPFYPKLLAKLQRIERGEMTLQDYIAEVENKVKGGQKP